MIDIKELQTKLKQRADERRSVMDKTGKFSTPTDLEFHRIKKRFTAVGKYDLHKDIIDWN